MSKHIIRFAPNQKLPPGYTVQWWESDEMYRWVIDENTYGIEFACPYAARRSAWCRYKSVEAITTARRMMER